MEEKVVVFYYYYYMIKLSNDSIYLLIHRALYLAVDLTIMSEDWQDFPFTFCFISTLKNVLNFNLH